MVAARWSAGGLPAFGCRGRRHRRLVSVAAAMRNIFSRVADRPGFRLFLYVLTSTILLLLTRGLNETLKELEKERDSPLNCFANCSTAPPSRAKHAGLPERLFCSAISAAPKFVRMLHRRVGAPVAAAKRMRIAGHS
jgi:hypothetical protein